MAKYKCEACGKKTSDLPNTLCLSCQSKGYFYRWGTVMRDKRVGKTASARKKNLKKLIKGQGVFGNIETSHIIKHGGLNY